MNMCIAVPLARFLHNVESKAILDIMVIMAIIITHNHNMTYYRVGNNAVSGGSYMMIGGYQGTLTASTSNYPLPQKGNSSETRPRNINVMYCIKL